MHGYVEQAKVGNQKFSGMLQTENFWEFKSLRLNLEAIQLKTSWLVT